MYDQFKFSQGDWVYSRGIDLTTDLIQYSIGVLQAVDDFV